MIYLLREKLGCTRDEILWKMPMPELNMMIHAFYFMEGRETRAPQEKQRLEGKLKRIMSIIRGK